jgi:5-methyltetrahydrofolate--homocysteine methyltransferase
MYMIIVGEKINTSRKSIADAVKERDAEFIGEVAREQAEAGAHYIDVNAGTFLDQEIDCLCWLVERNRLPVLAGGSSSK